MLSVTPCAAKSRADLAQEWDELAEERHRQIVHGEDISFDHILVPTTLRLLEGANTALVLDVGSGTGDFTVRLARTATTVIGIEPSGTCVALARRVCIHARNVHFVQATVEDAIGTLRGEDVTAAVAVMTLMTTPDIYAFAQALAGIVRRDAKFIAVLSHPWFWPTYWGYNTADWFSYERETFIEAAFEISLRRTKVITTHVHRPLEQYIRAFAEAGFRVEAISEPMPPTQVERLYPKPWRFPRFIGIRWAKVP